MPDTIFALATGAVPSAIAIIRLSGPRVASVLQLLADNIPPQGRLVLRNLRDETGALLDQGMIVFMTAPRTVTGEDYGEIHCHGGRSVVAAIERAIGRLPEVRRAKPGEFTRRALTNGKLDLSQAESLGDLLRAETEVQRRLALGGVGGELTRQIEQIRADVLAMSALVEAALDFSDDEDETALLPEFHTLRAEVLARLLALSKAPRAERLEQGFRVVIAGPPNTGKSTLFNRLISEDAALVSEIAGTTRDVIERRISLDGLPVTFSDTAGLRNTSSDVIENMGMSKARSQIDGADLVLWTGPSEEAPQFALQLATKADVSQEHSGHRTSGLTGEGVDTLLTLISRKARDGLGVTNFSFALTSRQMDLIEDALAELPSEDLDDLLLIGEGLRRMRHAFDSIVGRTDAENVIEGVLARFCIGK